MLRPTINRSAAVAPWVPQCFRCWARVDGHSHSASSSVEEETLGTLDDLTGMVRTGRGLRRQGPGQGFGGPLSGLGEDAGQGFS